MVVLAQEDTRTLRHSYIRTEQILLGLLREVEGLAGECARDGQLPLVDNGPRGQLGIWVVLQAPNSGRRCLNYKERIMIDNPPPARTSGGRPVSWFLCSIPLLAAGTLVAVRYGRSHNAAYTAGAVISTWFVGVLIAAGLRFAYIRSRDRRLHIIAPATLLIAGVTSLLADIGQVAADVGKNKTALSAARSDIVACVNSDQGPFTAPPRGYSYRPLAGSQRQTIEQGNATIASSPLGAGGARYDGRELIRRSTP